MTDRPVRLEQGHKALLMLLYEAHVEMRRFRDIDKSRRYADILHNVAKDVVHGVPAGEIWRALKERADFLGIGDDFDSLLARAKHRV